MIGSNYGVGYMNANHQRVVAHGQTRRGQVPVMVIRCGLCGHYYGAAESSLITQRCPGHDNGIEGQTAATEIDWLETRRPQASPGLRSVV